MTGADSTSATSTGATPAPTTSGATPTVLTGADDYLFLAGGAHDVQAYFSGALRARPAAVRQFHRNLRDRVRFCRDRGIVFAQVVFPDKVAVLPEQTPFDAQSLFLRDFSQDADVETRLGLLYPVDVLRAQPGVFHRTDTHYAAPGNVALAELLCTRMGPELTRAWRQVVSKQTLTAPQAGFCGDLGQKFEPRVREDTQVLVWPDTGEGGLSMASNGVENANDGVMVLCDNARAATGQTLLIFGDSFYRQMLPILTRLFRTIVFCRSRFFQAEMVAAVAPDVILTGMAERYLGSTRADDARQHFLAVPWAAGRASTPEPGFAALRAKIFDRETLTGSGTSTT